MGYGEIGVRRGLRSIMLSIAAVTVLLVASGCGDDDSSSASDGAAGGGDASACAQRAADFVAEESKPFEPVMGEQAFDMSQNRGKSIWYVTASQATGYGLGISRSAAKAAEAAGLEFTIFDGKGQPDRFTQGLTQAAAQDAAGVLLYGIDPNLVPEGLKRTKEAGIPVITMNSGKPAPPDGSVALAINMDTEAQGRQMANYAAQLTNCEVNGAISFDTTYPALIQVADAIKAQLDELCPDTCEVQDHKMKLADMATALGPSTQSLIQRNPDLNTIFATFDQVAIYQMPAIDRSQADVKIIGTNGNPENLAKIREGSPQVADVAYVPTEFYGWLGIDQIARAIAGEELAAPEGEDLILPVQTMDKETLGTDDSFEATYPELAGFEDSFREKWGL